MSAGADTIMLELTNGMAPPALVCSICQDLMLRPYTLTCGHSFCGDCTVEWFRTSEHRNSRQPTCAHCRAPLTTAPCPSHSLRELARMFVGPTELATIDAKNAGKPYDRSIFDEFRFSDGANAPVYDEEDDVMRCPECNHEVIDSWCSHCGMRLDAFDGGSDDFSDQDYISDGQDDELDSEDRDFLDDRTMSDIEGEEARNWNLVNLIDGSDDSDDDHVERFDAVLARSRNGASRLIDSDDDDDDDEEVASSPVGAADGYTSNRDGSGTYGSRLYEGQYSGSDSESNSDGSEISAWNDGDRSPGDNDNDVVDIDDEDAGAIDIDDSSADSSDGYDRYDYSD